MSVFARAKSSGTGPRRPRRLRDYFPLHEYPGESSTTGPLMLLSLLVVLLAGIVIAIIAGWWMWLLLGLLGVVGIIGWSTFVNRKR